MADLVAVAHIQDGFVRHSPGDILPSDSPSAQAWVESGAAVWREETPPMRPIARRVTAMPGLPGIAVGGEMTGDDLVGRVPLTPERMRGR